MGAAQRAPFLIPRHENLMRILNPIFAVLLALYVAACASQPQPDFTPPPKKPLDAKTQLETGRNY
jgi:hypothetical protein